jgi:hypothetical protein
LLPPNILAQNIRLVKQKRLFAFGTISNLERLEFAKN